MSKRKKRGDKGHQHVASSPEPRPLVAGLVQVVRPPRRSLLAVLDGLGRQKTVSRLWAVPCGKPCCASTERDAVTVALPTPELAAAHRSAGADGFAPIWVGVFNGHRGGDYLAALLDVEDAKQIVNALGEAIALAESEAQR